MAVRIQRNDGQEFRVEASLDQWESAFRRASAAGAVIEIELPDGRIMPLDPRAVESFREESEAELRGVPEEAAAGR